jgi:single-strand DNA-binding protein
MLRNQVTMVGQLGNDASITQFENGSMVARFQMAIETPTSSTTSAKSENKFYRMFAWGNTAAFVNQYCKKGNKLAVTGRLVNRTYLDEAGTPKKVTEIEVRQIVKF